MDDNQVLKPQIATVDDYVAVRDAREAIVSRLQKVPQTEPDLRFGLTLPATVWEIIDGALAREQQLARGLPLSTLLGKPTDGGA